jgi:hypothetical protein
MPKKSKRQTTLRGTITAHNVSPHGELEGVLLESADGTVQVNLPDHDDPELAGRLKLNREIELQVEPEASEGDHDIYVISPDPARVQGRVTQLNYTRHGEVNGYRLKDGTFVHVKPHGARAAKISVGDQIAAEGSLRVGSYARVIEVADLEKLGAKQKRR